jgi:hypothetical protein
MKTVTELCEELFEYLRTRGDKEISRVVFCKTVSIIWGSRHGIETRGDAYFKAARFLDANCPERKELKHKMETEVLVRRKITHMVTDDIIYRL